MSPPHEGPSSNNAMELQNVGPTGTEYSDQNLTPWDSRTDELLQYPQTLLNPVNHSQEKEEKPNFRDARGKLSKAYQRSMRFLLRSGRYSLDVSDDETQNPKANPEKRFSGWRGGVLAASCGAGLVLPLNVIITIWAASTSKSGWRIGTVVIGDCGRIRKIDKFIHILINILATILLGASSFTMQCLGSPTRREVDAAHSKRRHLDIGLPSIRNLIGRRKKVIWRLLLLSALPLHFLWNSAFFTQTQSLDYNIFVVNPSIFNASTVDCSQEVIIYRQPLDDSGGVGYYDSATSYKRKDLSPTNWYDNNICSESKSMLESSKKTRGGLTRLTNEQCINIYGAPHSDLAYWGSVYVVTKPLPVAGPIPAQRNDDDGYDDDDDDDDDTENDSTPKNTISTVLFSFRYQNYVSQYTGMNWVCGLQHLLANGYNCDFTDMAKAANSWSLAPIWGNANDSTRISNSTNEYPIDYCLANKSNFGGQCQLQYSVIIMFCVILANIVKLACMTTVLITQHGPVMATVGDCIASFLENPDETTVQTPFLSRIEAQKFDDRTPRLLIWRSIKSETLVGNHSLRGKPRRWIDPDKPVRWWKAPSRTRIQIGWALWASATLLAGHIFRLSIKGISSPLSLGFGAYNSTTVVSGLGVGGSDDSGNSLMNKNDFESNTLLLQHVVLVNLPRVIVSCLYFTFNAVITSMVSADEWSRYTVQRKALRTTDPRGAQRSTYWLGLPWTYALSMGFANFILHWLISQSIFLSRSEVVDTGGQVDPMSYFQIATSPSAFLASILFATIMGLAARLIGMRKLKPSVLVGNNSLAIAAACHPPDDDIGAELKKVNWGAVSHERDGIPGHCCFTSKDVVEPRRGRLYI